MRRIAVSLECPQRRGDVDANKESTVGSWPPKDGQCAMPDLGDLPYLSVFFAIHRYLAGGGPTDRKSYALVANYIRIVDKAVIDYGLAREQMELWATTPNEAFGHLPIAIGHFESCLAAMVRAVEFARRV